ncbi:hypothetical protein SY2F82_18830 [Streptomyces sp. Y2F8-2]|nr:hypothetical protein SY2F82_18830 [Streptomyces sp. Y2F8-2]
MWRFWNPLQSGPDLQLSRVSQAWPGVLDLFPEVHDVKRVVCLTNDADLPFRDVVPGRRVNVHRYGADGGTSSRR